MESDHDLFRCLGSAGSAFYGQFDTFREIQRRAINPILSRENVLITSATASGKTEALYAPIVSRLMRTKSAGRHIRVLGIAPTRALVNDLYTRLQRPLGELGWSCGRQTSDHADKNKRPDVLITTPESFDSMLVRNGQYKNGKLTCHILADVEVVAIDEVHLFYGNSRGDQLVWLLERLRRLRSFAKRQKFSISSDLQICGASATVASPELVAKCLLGRDANAICVPGTRDIEILTDDVGTDWRRLDTLPSISHIRKSLIRSNGPTDLLTIEHSIWRALTTNHDPGCRKVLVFVPTRSLCDKLSTYLADNLVKKRDIRALAHHGSLDKAIREQAEHAFSKARDVVLVATTTLEVGVDIGNVDAIVLVGPPPDTGALLQRIGRGGRKSGITRVVPIARNEVESCAMASMLAAAGNGFVDEKPYARRWSVFVQQTASYIAQSKMGLRTRRQLIDLADDVWPVQKNEQTAEKILNRLIQEGSVVEANGRITLGSQWSDSLEASIGGFHHNLDTEGFGAPVVDSSTGDIIAHIKGTCATGNTIALGGQRWSVVNASGEILLKPVQDHKIAESFVYSARAAPIRYNFAYHFLIGAGFQENDAPILVDAGKEVWVHGGGNAYEVVLLQLFPELKVHPGMKGLAVMGSPDEGMIRRVISAPALIKDTISMNAEVIEFSLSPGPYQKTLPEDVRREVVLDLFGVDGFIEWLSTRRIWKA